MAPSSLSNGPSARAVFSTRSRLDIDLQIDQAKGPGYRAVDPDRNWIFRGTAGERQGGARASRTQRLERRRAHFHAGRCVGKKL